MVKCEIIDEHIKLHFTEAIEAEQFDICFNTRKIRNAKFKTARNKWWDGTVKFMKNNTLPIGFWYMIKETCEEYGFKYGYKNLSEIKRNVSKREVAAFCNKLMEGHVINPYDYQIDTVYKLATYKYSMADLSTAAGKTLVMYMYIQYMRWKGFAKKFLIITPDSELVMQGYGDFMDYTEHLDNSSLKIGMVHGGNSLKSIGEFNVSIGNFQTLSNRKQEFFEGIDAIITDEAHRSKAKSITDIFNMCVDVKSRVGMSGTIIVDKSADYYQLVANMGPIVRRVTKRDLMDAKRATSVKIEIRVLNYLKPELRKELLDAKLSKNREGSAMYDLECKLYRQSEARIDYIANLVASLDGNCIVFFRDKKHEYGKKIVNRIKQNSDKTVYYVDGDTPKKVRNMYKAEMDNGINKVLVANWVTFGTGKSINSLKYAIAAENQKSEEQIGQGIGRLMRLDDSMDEATWFDLVDDFRLNYQVFENGAYHKRSYENILYRHMGFRVSKIYEKDKLEVNTEHVDLMEFT